MASPINRTLLQGGWQLVPGRQSVVFKTQTAPGTFSSATVKNAFYRDKGEAESAPSSGAAVKALRDWYLVKRFKPARPRVGDRVRDGSDEWTVLECTEAGAQGSWRASCVKLLVRPDLSDTATIYLPAVGQNAWGGRLTTPRTALYSAVPAKFQVVDSFSGVAPIASGDRLGKRMSPPTYKVYLGVALTDLQAQSIVVNDATGQAFTVQNVTRPAMLD